MSLKATLGLAILLTYGGLLPILKAWADSYGIHCLRDDCPSSVTVPVNVFLPLGGVSPDEALRIQAKLELLNRVFGVAGVGFQFSAASREARVNLLFGRSGPCVSGRTLRGNWAAYIPVDADESCILHEFGAHGFTGDCRIPESSFWRNLVSDLAWELKEPWLSGRARRTLRDGAAILATTSCLGEPNGQQDPTKGPNGKRTKK